MLAHGRWFSPGTPASSTTTTGRHDIAEILLKVALNTINEITISKSSLDIGNFTQCQGTTGFTQAKKDLTTLDHEMLKTLKKSIIRRSADNTMAKR